MAYHGGQRHALDAGVGEGIEDGGGHIGKAGGLEVGGQHVHDGPLAVEDAHGVDGDGGDQNGDAHVGGGRPDDAGAEDGQHQDQGAHGHHADVVVHAEVGGQGGGGAGDGGGHRHQHHDVEEDLKEPHQLVEGMVEGLEKLLVTGEAPGVVHDHGLPHGQRQQQHGHDGGRHAGPSQAHVVGVGLVAGGEAAAGVGGEQHRAHGEGGNERGLRVLGLHVSFLLQKDG